MMIAGMTQAGLASALVGIDVVASATDAATANAVRPRFIHNLLLVTKVQRTRQPARSCDTVLRIGKTGLATRPCGLTRAMGTRDAFASLVSCSRPRASGVLKAGGQERSP